ncbi:MAG: SoxR reducing system RseC family protein [Bacteroidales bacterium]|jgi:sigma-E factor negative regulatory protein RseC|nr:SoxR reducing system RseC family protein [Bacteroidales bacterium]MCI2122478.1 SoxR reducing system RseC family protein [Bacteroidales bacterium]MCI2146256.1 SoxR reducing system RseC family protein [Bacteroidales bacterium]
MSYQNSIEHNGVVTAVDGDNLTVEIERQSACGSCSAKAICGLSGNDVKLFDVKRPAGRKVEVGDKVVVVMKSSMGLGAVLISYVFPLIILLGLLLYLLKIGVAEPLAALSSVVAIAIYYVIVYLFRGKLKYRFKFSLKE